MIANPPGTDGLSGVFWLFMNYGQWFSSKRKIFLTVVNFLTFGMGLAVVSFLSLSLVKSACC